MRYVALVVMLFVVYGCASSASTGADITPPLTPYPVGLSDATISVGGVTRVFRVHVPAGLTAAPKAIVFALHGGGGIGLDAANSGEHALSVFRTVADRAGFVVVYPGGLPALDSSAAWSDCRGDNLVASRADDIGFLESLIARVRGEYKVPVSRVFMAGGSNGGLMTLAFAFQRPLSLNAIATSSANLPQNPRSGACATGPGLPIAALMTHGTADPQMPYDGGCVANIGGACNRGRVISAVATRDRFLQLNRLSAVAPATSVVELDPTDGGPANRFIYAGASPVWWWRLDGAGHTMASRTVLTQPNPLTGVQNRDVEFAEIAWAFFASRLPPAA